MFTRSIGRFGAAAVLAVGLLLATSTPASASATGVIIEESSNIAVVRSGTTIANVHIKGHATTNVCAPNSTAPTAIPVTFDSNGGGVIGSSTTGWGDFVLGTTTFKTRLVIVSGTATLTATGATVNLVIRAEFRTCDSLTVVCNTNNVGITLSGPSVGLHPTTSTRVTASGTSGTISTQPGCNFILAIALNGSTANASLNLHFV